MKHKCAYRSCKEEASLIWSDSAYFCEKHFKEMLKKVKEEAGIK